MKISILGTGALGIAIAKVLENKGHTICMWTKFKEEKETLDLNRENNKLLPGIKIDKNITITDNLEEAIESAALIINALPFIAVEQTARDLKQYIKSDQIICSTTKGIDEDTFKTTTDIFRQEMPNNILCALSGPSFAIELAKGENISFVLASNEIDKCTIVKEIFESQNITIEQSKDEIGIQICGAIKNAIAIGSGMLFGMEAADSTKAAYLARGIKDMVKVIEKLGGKEETVYSFAGVGDLILTCMSEKSRNFSFGKLIGQGKTREEAISGLGGKTVEGVKVIESLHNYMEKEKIRLDTIPKLYNIIYGNEKVDSIKG